MKIYFDASLIGKKINLTAYQKIIKITKELGHEIVYEHALKRDYEQLNLQSKLQHVKNFNTTRKLIEKNDSLIIECTHPSIGLGRIIGIALDRFKPILLLSLNTPHGLLIGDPNRLLTVNKYKLNDEADLKKILASFFQKAEKKSLKYKFNLMIDEIQNEYLETQSIKYKISKAEYLRKLIDEATNKKN